MAASGVMPCCAWSRARLSGRCNSLLIIRRRRPPAGIEGSSLTLDLADASGPDALIGAGRHSWLLRLPAQRVVPVAAPRVGPGDPRSARAARWPANRPDQRPPHRALLRAPVFRSRRRRLPRLAGRPGRHDRRPGRGRRNHQLGRAAPEPAGGPAGQVRHPGQPRQRASTASIAGELDRAGFEMLEGGGRRSTSRERHWRSAARRPLGAGLRPRATSRRPTSASCSAIRPTCSTRPSAGEST